MILNGHFLCRNSIEERGGVKNILNTCLIIILDMIFSEKSCNNMLFSCDYFTHLHAQTLQESKFLFFGPICFAFNLTLFNDASNW